MEENFPSFGTEARGKPIGSTSQNIVTDMEGQHFLEIYSRIPISHDLALNWDERNWDEIKSEISHNTSECRKGILKNKYTSTDMKLIKEGVETHNQRYLNLQHKIEEMRRHIDGEKFYLNPTNFDTF